MKMDQDICEKISCSYCCITTKCGEFLECLQEGSILPVIVVALAVYFAIIVGVLGLAVLKFFTLKKIQN